MNQGIIDARKKEISNIRAYEEELQDLKIKLMQIQYAEENVHGISYDRQPGTTNPAVISQNRLALADEREKIEQQVNEVLCLVNRVLRLLNAMEKEDRRMVMDVLVDRKAYAKVCEERDISSTSVLFKRINGIVEDAIKKAE